MHHVLAAFRSRTGRVATLAAIAAATALAAIQLHRSGHLLGDDFALYLRQAQSIFEGNPDQVVADNRFMVRNSPDGISPIAYPWGWPLLLSPFVQWWGLDFANLKLIEVGLLCVALVLLHGIVRRRTNRWIATAVVLVIGSSPVYLAHTDQLLSEYPHLVATLVVIWWMDRIQRVAPDPERPWLTARTSDLVVVGLLATFAFNVRRESLVLFAVIGAAQAVEVFGALRRRRAASSGPTATSGDPLEAVDVRRLAIPHGVFVSGIIGFQLLLPSMLIPDNGGGLGHIPERVGDSFAVITQHLGLYTGSIRSLTGSGISWIGVIVIGLAAVGALVACRRNPRQNVPLLTLLVTTMATVGTHFRLVDRYYLQVTPWILFFAAYALYAFGGAITSLQLGRHVDQHDGRDVRDVDASPRAPGWVARTWAHHRLIVAAAALIVVGAVGVAAIATFGGDEAAAGYETPWPAVIAAGCALIAFAVVAAVVATSSSRRPAGTQRAGAVGRVATAVAVVPLIALAVWHVTDLPHRFDSAETFSEDTTDVPRCNRQWLSEAEPPGSVFTAVETMTPPDSVIAFYRGRLMTLYTDRQSIQPGRLETIARRADFYAMQRGCTYSQPLVTDEEAAEADMTKIWEDEQWVIWQFPDEARR